MGLSVNRPPYGMQESGGSKNRPALNYPGGKFQWPDLTVDLQTAIRVEDGQVKENRLSQSSCDLLEGFRAEGVSITSECGKENGFYIKGGEKYVLESARISLGGDGTNDFSCIGAGVTADGESTLVVRNCDIETTGLVRSCTTATRGSILKVYDSKLIANGGVLPEGYDPKPGPGGMLTPPKGLGIGGTSRAHLSMDHSKSYFYNTVIESDGWAALSTDASCGYVYLEADNCDLVVKNPGYGVYSDGDCHVVLKNCWIDTATHTGILAGNCTAKFENTVAKSGKYFIMAHNVMGIPEEVAELTVIAGEIQTGQEAILLRSVNTYIDMQGVELYSDSGILFHAIVNPDECATKTEGKKVFGNNIVLSDMDVTGDIVNDDMDRTMAVTLSGTSIRGAMKDIYLSLDGSSKWYATEDSTVVIVDKTEDAVIDAGSGVTITAYFGGENGLQSCDLPSGGWLQIV